MAVDPLYGVANVRRLCAYSTQLKFWSERSQLVGSGRHCSLPVRYDEVTWRKKEMLCKLRPVYSDATQLNSRSSWVASAGRYRHFADATQLHSTSSWVELRRYRHLYRRNSIVANDRRCNWPSWSICHINRHVFFHNSINFSSISSLQNSISRQTRQNTSYMTSWPTNWVNWVTTFRTDRWQLFTLWTCRQLNVELSWVELRRRRYRHFADATQLNSTSSWVELSCVAISGPLVSSSESETYLWAG